VNSFEAKSKAAAPGCLPSPSSVWHPFEDADLPARRDGPCHVIDWPPFATTADAPKSFWLRWHEPKGREHYLRKPGLKGRRLKVAQSNRGARHLAGTGSLQSALSNATLRRYGFLMPSDLAGC
jgi:hypothetical protein